MEKIIWSSTVTADMIGMLSEDEKASLIESLDDAVMQVCEDFGIEG